MFTQCNSDFRWSALRKHGRPHEKVFQSILFPVDFSPACDGVASYVRELAKSTGGRITLLHVVPARSGWFGAADINSADPDETLRRIQKLRVKDLEEFRREHFSDIDCDIKVDSGPVAERIIDYAAHDGTDLIMMPTRGTGTNGRSSLGSNTQKVLRDATCAVWTSPHFDKLKAFRGFHNIVCAIAPDTVLGAYVIETAALGEVFNSKLSFVSASSVANGFGEEPRVLPIEQEYPEAGLDQLPGGCQFPVYVETGPVGHVVRHVAEAESADLVVINRGHMANPLGKFETHAYEIVLESPCPVLRLPTRATAACAGIALETYSFAAACS